MPVKGFLCQILFESFKIATFDFTLKKSAIVQKEIVFYYRHATHAYDALCSFFICKPQIFPEKHVIASWLEEYA